MVWYFLVLVRVISLDLFLVKSFRLVILVISIYLVFLTSIEPVNVTSFSLVFLGSGPCQIFRSVCRSRLSHILRCGPRNLLVLVNSASFGLVLFGILVLVRHIHRSGPHTFISTGQRHLPWSGTRHFHRSGPCRILRSGPRRFIRSGQRHFLWSGIPGLLIIDLVTLLPPLL